MTDPAMDTSRPRRRSDRVGFLLRAYDSFWARVGRVSLPPGGRLSGAVVASIGELTRTLIALDRDRRPHLGSLGDGRRHRSRPCRARSLATAQANRPLD